MVLLIDNYDSFVHNLARYITQLGFESQVVRNDALSLQDITQYQPSHIVLSPGPCTPAESGVCLDLIAQFYQQIPLLGICLGHQAIAQAFGGLVCQAKVPMHGMRSTISHQQQGLFTGLPNPLKVGRYHSLIVSEQGLPPQLDITARSPEREIMALQHREYPVFGVQFHPESILTEHGYPLLQNFLGYHRDSPPNAESRLQVIKTQV